MVPLPSFPTPATPQFPLVMASFMLQSGLCLPNMSCCGFFHCELSGSLVIGHYQKKKKPPKNCNQPDQRSQNLDCLKVFPNSRFLSSGVTGVVETSLLSLPAINQSASIMRWQGNSGFTGSAGRWRWRSSTLSFGNSGKVCFR